MHHFAIHRERFNLTMSEMQNGATGSFIDPAGLHADEAIFDEVHTADAMFAAELIQRLHYAEWTGVLAVYRHAIAALKLQGRILRFVRGVFGRHAELIHVFV